MEQIIRPVPYGDDLARRDIVRLCYGVKQLSSVLRVYNDALQLARQRLRRIRLLTRWLDPRGRDPEPSWAA